jgi:chromodomain-helicase-DNA-binding protein 1
VVYVGDSSSREAIRSIEFNIGARAGPAASEVHPGCSPRTHRFEVIITTYELILKDAPILGKIE